MASSSSSSSPSVNLTLGSEFYVLRALNILARGRGLEKQLQSQS